MSKAAEREQQKAAAEQTARAARCNADIAAVLKRHDCRLVSGLNMSDEGGPMAGMPGMQFTLTIFANPKR